MNISPTECASDSCQIRHWTMSCVETQLYCQEVDSTNHASDDWQRKYRTQFQRGFRQQSMAPHKTRLDSTHRSRSPPRFHAAQQGKSNPSGANENARIGKGCLGKSNRSFSGKLFLLSKCAHLKSGTRLHFIRSRANLV